MAGCRHTMVSVINGTGVQAFGCSDRADMEEKHRRLDWMEFRAGALNILVVNISGGDQFVVIEAWWRSLILHRREDAL